MNRKCLTFLIASIQGAGRASTAGSPPPASAAPSAGAEGMMSPPLRPAGSQPGALAGPSAQPTPLPVSIDQMYFLYRNVMTSDSFVTKSTVSLRNRPEVVHIMTS